MKKIIVFALAVAASLGSLGAQITEIGGEMIGAANMKPSDAIKFSQTDHTYMTARVAAMGGAYTSLGADLSSMAINPAGLGMYRQSVGSLSSAFTTTNSFNSFDAAGTKKSQMSLNNVGVALNLFQSSGTLVSFTFGFGFNKLADLNYNQSYTLGTTDVSIADFFAEQMYGIPKSMVGGQNPFNDANIYVDEWGGTLAYKTYLIDPSVDDDACKEYIVSGIGANADIFPEMYVRSIGYIDEYDFSSGFNIANKLYLGVTLGIQDISQTIRYTYGETYNHKLASDADPNGYLNRMSYMPQETSQGAGVNIKLGAIWRPTSSLRVGIAYHSPTAVALNRSFFASMETVYPDYTYSDETLTNSYTYNYSSPGKLLLGASYTIGSRAIISVDYDMVYYNQTRLNDESASVEDDFGSAVVSEYTTANNFRAGIEIRPAKDIYLRGGYAFYGSPFNKALESTQDKDVYFANNKRSTEAFSLGLGMRFSSGSSFDLAWVRSTSKYTNYRLFDFYYLDDTQELVKSSPDVLDSKQVKSIVSATYTFVF